MSVLTDECVFVDSNTFITLLTSLANLQPIFYPWKRSYILPTITDIKILGCTSKNRNIGR